VITNDPFPARIEVVQALVITDDLFPGGIADAWTLVITNESVLAEPLRTGLSKC
jgi:hypothetical protein